MNTGLPLQRITVSAKDYQELNNLIATYVISYDDFHDGRLKKSEFRKIAVDLFTDDIVYGFKHAQLQQFGKSIKGFKALWNFWMKESFVNQVALFHIISPILITKCEINQSGLKEITFRCRLMINTRKLPKHTLMMLNEDSLMKARFVNNKWKICSVTNRITTLKPGSLKSKL